MIKIIVRSCNKQLYFSAEQFATILFADDLTGINRKLSCVAKKYFFPEKKMYKSRTLTIFAGICSDDFAPGILFTHDLTGINGILSCAVRVFYPKQKKM